MSKLTKLSEVVGDIVVTSPYIADLALITRDNEAIDETRLLTHTVEGVEVPIDITGWEFFAEARTQKNGESELICTIQISIVGSGVDGRIRYFVPIDTLRTAGAVKGHHDVLYRKSPTGSIDNLYMAPFVIEKGVSVWTA